MPRKRLATMVLPPLLLGSLAMIVVSWFVLDAARQKNIEQAGGATARALLDQVRTVRSFYTVALPARPTARQGQPWPHPGGGTAGERSAASATP